MLEARDLPARRAVLDRHPHRRTRRPRRSLLLRPVRLGLRGRHARGSPRSATSWPRVAARTSRPSESPAGGGTPSTPPSVEHLRRGRQRRRQPRPRTREAGGTSDDGPVRRRRRRPHGRDRRPGGRECSASGRRSENPGARLVNEPRHVELQTGSARPIPRGREGVLRRRVRVGDRHVRGGEDGDPEMHFFRLPGYADFLEGDQPGDEAGHEETWARLRASTRRWPRSDDRRTAPGTTPRRTGTSPFGVADADAMAVRARGDRRGEGARAADGRARGSG